MTDTYYAEIMPRSTLANAIETFQRTIIPQDGTIEKLTFVIDLLQAGGTDSADTALVAKLNLINIYGGGGLKSTITHSDLVRAEERTWGVHANLMTGEADNEGISTASDMFLNPICDARGNVLSNMPYGAAPGMISMIELITAANQAATDTGFLSVYAQISKGKTGSAGWTQFKQKLRTAVDGAVEFDNISDIQRLFGFGAFITNGQKDVATAIPDDLDIQSVALTYGAREVTTRMNVDGFIRGGIQYLNGSITATAANAANYDWIWIDTGLKDGGMVVPSNSAWRVLEGNTGDTRRYTIGLGT